MQPRYLHFNRHGLKGTGCDTDHLPPSDGEAKNVWSYTSATFLSVFTTWC